MTTRAPMLMRNWASPIRITWLPRLLPSAGRIINSVSAPDIYTDEWASITTRDFPENLTVIDERLPLATGDEPWASKTAIAPWTIYVLAGQP